MKTIIALVFFLSYSLVLPAQNEPSIRLQYQGYNLFHAGLEVGYESSLLHWYTSTKKEKQRWYQVYYAPNLGVYNFKGNHVGFTLGTDLGAKMTFNKGFELELFGGAHFVRAQNAQTTFTQNTEGGFSEVNGAGNNYFQWRAGLGFGKNFLPQGKPFSVHMKLGITKTSFPSPPITPNVWIGVNYFFKYGR